MVADKSNLVDLLCRRAHECGSAGGCSRKNLDSYANDSKVCMCASDDEVLAHLPILARVKHVHWHQRTSILARSCKCFMIMQT